MELPALTTELNAAYGLDLPETTTVESLENLLAEKVNAMIESDFPALVRLLYRIDVSEERLKKILREQAGTDAGILIARLILERQWQKIETRRKYSR